MAINPRKTAQWQALNGIDYGSKLSPEEKAWLDEFNCQHFKEYRKGSEVLDYRRPLEINPSITKEHVMESFTSPPPKEISLEDINFWLETQRGKSQRSISREYGIPKTTLVHRLKLVERFLESVNWDKMKILTEESE
jgi:hypothetical protein